MHANLCLRLPFGSEFSVATASVRVGELVSARKEGGQQQVEPPGLGESIIRSTVMKKFVITVAALVSVMGMAAATSQALARPPACTGDVCF